MSRKAKIRWLVVSAGVAVLGYLSARVFFIHTYAQSELQVRPYIAAQVSFASTSGKEVIFDRRTESRRRDGSVHKLGVMYRSDGSEAGTFRRVDFADGVVGMIVDKIQAKATGRVDSSRLAAYKAFVLNPPPNCASRGYKVDGEELLFGHRAILLTRQTDAGSNLRELSWALPDFNCATVQSYKQERTTADEEWRTISGLRLISFVEADPDARDFTNWSQYQEMRPSELKRKLAETAGLTPQSCSQCFADDPSDREYQLANKK